MSMNIREATRIDFEHIWPIFHEIATAGETYAYPQDISRQQAQELCLDAPGKTYLIEEGGKLLGTYSRSVPRRLVPSKNM